MTQSEQPLTMSTDNATSDQQSFGLLLYYDDDDRDGVLLARIIGRNKITLRYTATDVFTPATIQYIRPYVEEHLFILLEATGTVGESGRSVFLNQIHLPGLSSELNFRKQPHFSASTASQAEFFQWLRTAASRVTLANAADWSRLLVLLGIMVESLPTTKSDVTTPVDVESKRETPQVSVSDYLLVYAGEGSSNLMVRLIRRHFVSRAYSFAECCDNSNLAERPIGLQDVLLLSLLTHTKEVDPEIISVFNGRSQTATPIQETTYTVRLKRELTFERARVWDVDSFITLLVNRKAHHVLQMLSQLGCPSSPTPWQPPFDRIRRTPVRFGEDDAASQDDQKNQIYLQHLADTLLVVCSEGDVSIRSLLTCLGIRQRVTVDILNQALRSVDLVMLRNIAVLAKSKVSIIVDIAERRSHLSS